MWYNQPTYISYSPYGYGYVNSGDPYARAPRERTSRGRDAAAYHPHWQQTQGAAQYPYNSYLSGGEGSFVSYPYQSHAYDYNPYVHEDTNRRQVREQERQLELARQADLNRKREEERTYKPQEVSFVASGWDTSDQKFADRLAPLSFSKRPRPLPTFQSLSHRLGKPLPTRVAGNALKPPDTRPHHPRQSL